MAQYSGHVFREQVSVTSSTYGGYYHGIGQAFRIFHYLECGHGRQMAVKHCEAYGTTGVKQVHDGFTTDIAGKCPDCMTPPKK